jgi:PTS system mannose-specific IID component
MNPLGMRARAATFARLFLAQATFNNRTMIGSGLAFCLVPVFRRLYHDEPDRLEAAISRHVGLFNSHPYLTGMAVGAVARMEVEGAEPNAVERFKTAVSGPLGSLGDQLIWATWLPAVALLAGGLGLLRVRPLYAVVAFLLIYNVGHVGLRLWALAAGLRSGPLVAAQIRRANLPQWTARLGSLLAFSVGTMLGGLALMAGAGGQRATLAWGAVTVIGFGVGARGGIGAWRATVTGFVTVVLGLAIAGVVS